MGDNYMNKANVMISRSNEGYNIKVDGRATFECSSPIKNFADNIVPGVIKKIIIDLQNCTWMDSTFMGTLAKLGLHAKKANISICIINSDNKNIKLLKELGIHRLFIFCKGDSVDSCTSWDNFESFNTEIKPNIAETVLDAHETLMAVDKNNITKFCKVVELVKKDIKKEK